MQISSFNNPSHTTKQSHTHSTPPFIGRDTEVATILNIYRNSLKRDFLSVCLIEGEAGIGKSRLLEEATHLLKDEGASIISIRLYPDSASSVMSLLANTIFAHPTLNELLINNVEPTLPSTMAALRRLIRLRSVIILIEDVHLLQREGLEELKRLIQGLFREPTTIICSFRPGYNSVQ